MALLRMLLVGRPLRVIGCVVTMAMTAVLYTYTLRPLTSHVAKTVLDSVGLRPNVPPWTCEQCMLLPPPPAKQDEHTCAKNESIDLLIVVMSKAKDEKGRNNIRRTWGASIHGDSPRIRTLFFIGTPSTIEKPQVRREMNRHHDIVILPIVFDRYEGLTNKSIRMLHWINSHCSDAKYILKTDDDCYNNPISFWNYIQERKLPPDFIGGRCFTVKPDRKPKSKWYVSPELYPDAHYPYYCGGPAYIMPNTTLKRVLEVQPSVPYFPMEDVYITGFCRTAAGVHYVNIPGVQGKVKDAWNCNGPEVRNLHHVKNSENLAIWNFTQHRQRICSSVSG